MTITMKTSAQFVGRQTSLASENQFRLFLDSGKTQGEKWAVTSSANIAELIGVLEGLRLVFRGCKVHGIDPKTMRINLGVGMRGLAYLNGQENRRTDVKELLSRIKTGMECFATVKFMLS